MKLPFMPIQSPRVVQCVSMCLLLGLCMRPAQADEPLVQYGSAQPASTKRSPVVTITEQTHEELLSFTSTPKDKPLTPRDEVLTPKDRPLTPKDELLSRAEPVAPELPAATSGSYPLLPPIVSHADSSLPNDIGQPAGARTPQLAAPQSQSVSAQEYLRLPARMGARSRHESTVNGPSESEMRDIFFRAVEQAIARSPEVSRSKAEQEAAISDIDEAKGQRWPQVDVGSHSRAVQFGKGSGIDSPSGGFDVTVTTVLYDWGRIKKTIGSREKLGLAADERLAAQLEDTSYEVVSTLIELGKQRLISDLSAKFSKRMGELVKMLAGIVAVDPGRGSELTQAKARLLQAQALKDAADAKARDAEINLRKLVGESPVPIPRSPEWNIGLAQLEQLLVASQSHPTLLQGQAEVESAELQAQAIHASGLPQLNWGISKSTATDALGNPSPFQTNLSVTWSAFRGGSNRAAERAAFQRANASRYEVAQQGRDLEFRIRTADNDARTQLERAELYRDLSVESDRVREDFYLQWHHLGKRTLLDVLTAENDHYGNQVNEVSNRFDGYLSTVREYAGAGVLSQWLQGHKWQSIR